VTVSQQAGLGVCHVAKPGQLPIPGLSRGGEPAWADDERALIASGVGLPRKPGRRGMEASVLRNCPTGGCLHENRLPGCCSVASEGACSHLRPDAAGSALLL